MIGDYYLTNREITKEYDARYRQEKETGKKQPWSKGEWTMLGVTLLAAILLLIKYGIFS